MLLKFNNFETRNNNKKVQPGSVVSSRQLVSELRGAHGVTATASAEDEGGAGNLKPTELAKW